MNQRTISWGTVIAGGLALGLALVVGLTQVGGVSIPFSSAGPGVIVLVGVLILLAGLFAVIRSNRRTTAAGSGVGSGSTPGAPTSAEPAASAARPGEAAPAASAAGPGSDEPAQPSH